MSEVREEDPYKWSIDQVVYELCHNPHPRWLAGGLPDIPARQLLEGALRDNHVDGQLLLELSPEDIKSELNIKSLGQRKAIHKAIRFLRSERQSATPAPLSGADRERRTENWIPTPSNSRFSLNQVSPAWPGFRPHTFRSSHDYSAFGDSPIIPSRESPLRSDEPLHNTAPADTVAEPSQRPSISSVRHPRTVASNLFGRPSPGALAARHQISSTHVSEPQVKTETAQPSTNDQGGLLDNLEAYVIGNLDDPSGTRQSATAQPADQISGEAPTSTPKVKKRIAPTLIEPALSDDSLQQANDSPWYLGEHALPLQDTFYGGNGDHNHEWSLIGVLDFEGQNIVTANRIRRFLLSKPTIVPGLGYDAVARIPYSRRNCVGSSEAYFTLFAQNAPPSIQILQDWPVLLPSDRSQRLMRKRMDSILPDTEDPSRPFSLDLSQNRSTSSDLGDFAYLLDRYPVDENETSNLLPVYGDSGDEDEFDEETWAEITAEQQEKSKASTALSREEAAVTVEQALEDIRQKWSTSKLPKVQMKAYRLWMRVAKARKRQNDIAYQYGIRNRKLAVLEKLKDHVLQERWRSTDQIKHQCEALEETLYQILEAEHLLTVLHHDHAPEKPTKHALKRKPDKPVLQEDEELLESESEVEFDHEMDGFVSDNDDVAVPDDPTDQDFNPVIPRGPPSTHPRFDGANGAGARPALLQSDISTDLATPIAPPEYDPSPERYNQAKSMGVDESQIIHEPEPAPQGSNEPVASAADDADIDSDVADNPIPKSVDKKRRSMVNFTSHKAVTSDDWSSSARLSLVSDDDSSDFDALPRLPLTRYKSFGKSLDTAIEVLSSDAPQPEAESTSPEYSVETPPLNPLDSEDRESHRTLRAVSKLKMDRSPAPAPQTTTNDSRGRRKAILEFALGARSEKDRQEIGDLVLRLVSKQGKAAELAGLLREGIIALLPASSPPGTIRSLQIPNIPANEQRAAYLLTVLMVSYINTADLLHHENYRVTHINAAFDQYHSYVLDFHTDLLISLKLGERPGKRPAEEPPGRPLERKRKRIESEDETEISESGLEELDDVVGFQVTDTEGGINLTPHAKKKKKKVAQSKQVRDTQQDDKLRVQEQEARRELLIQKMQRFDTNTTCHHAVNSKEPILWLEDHIAKRVKPHQVQGIQFLWREIVDDPKLQGCLLAHTMGLGKTMQVISLLVTIAQCRRHPDQAVVSQLPDHIRNNTTTLILCPPSLLENWYDELLMWSPPNDNQLLGVIVKIVQGRTAESYSALQKWTLKGGVLIMSYDTFRSLLRPRNGKPQHEQQVPEYEKWLLDTPSIVVADEAHKLKNAKSKISAVAQRFKTLSRIALTGSPLNNHLEEYHTMVEWIAPNYLGNLAQFRSRYVDPITAGLYANSSAYERRLCLKKLHVLKKDLEPKVNRADITAIRSDMPPKTEYIITIPLAKEQRTAYDLYVEALLRHHTESEGTASTTLFKWLNKLTILANHPSCFIKLYNKYEDMLGNDKGYGSSTDLEKQTDQQATRELAELVDYEPLNVVKVSQFDIESMQKAVDVFRQHMEFGSSEDPGLSYRTAITQKILEKAVAVGDKTLVFSQSIPTLDYLEDMLRKIDPNVMRIDGSTAMSKRQKMTKEFNRSHINGADARIILISTKAGGLGLNLQGANRVIIFDSGFNPMWEEQAVGRAYRLGQTSPVYVYRFKCGGTFEEPIYNKALFKTQLFQRVVDKKNPTRAADRTVSEYLFPSKNIKKQEFSPYIGRDPRVLDVVLREVDYVHNIELTETFQKDDGEELDEEDLKQANMEYEDERLRREDHDAWLAKHTPRYQYPSMAGGIATGFTEAGGVPGQPFGYSRIGDKAVGGNRASILRDPKGRTVDATHGTHWLHNSSENLYSTGPHTAAQARATLHSSRFAGDSLYGRFEARPSSSAFRFDGPADFVPTDPASVSIEHINRPQGERYRGWASHDNYGR